MEHNTKPAAVTAATTQAAKGGRGHFATLSDSQAATIAAALLRKYHSRQGTKEHRAELIAKYGKDNYKAIDKAIQASREATIKAEAEKARAGLREWEKAAREAMAAARAGGHFAKLAALASAKYATAADFIAACYPNTIDGAPAVLVQYVTGPEAATIVAAYEPAAYDGRNARAIVDTCLARLERALQAANKGGKAYAAPAQAREAGKIVAAYDTKPGAALGTIAKGSPVSPEALQAYSKGNAAGLVRLSAYNAQARKDYDTAAAAEAMAAITGEAPSPEAVAILSREPRHKWLTQAPKAPKAPKGAKGGKGKGKGKAEPAQAAKPAPVSPEAMAQAREAMAAIDAFIAAGRAEAKAMAEAARVTA